MTHHRLVLIYDLMRVVVVVVVGWWLVSGEPIDKVLMKNCLAMLVEVNVTSLDVYQEDFERDFLRQTREFYTRESQVFMSSNTCPDYLRKVLHGAPACVVAVSRCGVLMVC